MDYLVYVELNAENLQFYLWYQDYCRRFDALAEKEKALSPIWIPENKEAPDLTAKDPEKKVRRDTVGTLMDTGFEDLASQILDDEGQQQGVDSRQISNTKSIRSPSLAGTSTKNPPDGSATMKWKPFTIQPLREEINRVMRHYLAFSSPRELNLSHKDRALCFHALQHTTHPSALLHAVLITEAALRGQSHPNFIRWSICNGNKPRVFFVRTMGVSNIVLGFVIAVLLTLSRASRWWRILAAIEWYIGITTMVAAYKGLCVILHHTRSRNLQPWESTPNSELGLPSPSRNSFSSTSYNRSIQLASQTLPSSHSTKTSTEFSSFKPESMKTFGPKNNFEDEEWVERYRRKGVVGKVFERSVWIQDESLRVLQDRIVVGANVWAVVGTVVLTVVFVAIPKGNYY